jgi:DNA polymerase IV
MLDFESQQGVHPSLESRKIIHIDMDAFYASVELRDQPSLGHRPVVIGGDPQSRGVVCTANYIARKYGIHSAMACSRAFRLCPDAVFIRPNFEKYRAVSRDIRRIFASYTDMIEPLSLDEAYLDVTRSHTGLFAVKIANNIRVAIKQQLNLTASAGVGPNKMIAKIASDFNKPDGITIVLPQQVSGFMEALSLRKIPGIGPKTETRLKAFGLVSCRDAKDYQLAQLCEMLGERLGSWIYRACRGIDERSVSNSSERKSLGKEETFTSDLLNRAEIEKELKVLAISVSKSLENKGYLAKTLTLKVKYGDFQTITRSKTLDQPFDNSSLIERLAIDLLDKTEAGARPIRLVGVSVSIWRS